MNKVDRLYIKALAGKKDRETRSRIVEVIMELEAWHDERRKEYASGSYAQHCASGEEYNSFLEEMERKYG